MSNDRSQNRKVMFGTLLVASVVGIAAFMFFAPDIFRLAEPSIELVTFMPDAAALDTKTPVWIGGREVGTIKEISFRGAATDSMERLAAVLRIPTKFASQVRKDSRTRITSDKLIGNPVIDIVPGSFSSPPVHDHDTIPMTRQGTLEDVMAQAMKMTTSFDRLIVDARSFQRSAQRGSQRMAEIQANLAQISTGFRDFSVALRNSPMNALSDPEFQATLSRISRQNGELQAALRRALQRAQKASSDVQPALKRLMARSDTIMHITTKLRAGIAENGGGLLIRAQKDSAIVKALHEASVQMDSLMAETKRNPLRFWF